MLTKEQLLALLQQVTAVAKEAGRLMRDEAMTQIYEKDGHANFVTNMDLKVQTLVIESLTKIFPEAEVFAEEQENERPKGYCWIIDPIDGTNNYIVDYHHSCVSIALIDENEGILGVVYNPYLDEVFYGAKGCGAYVNGVPIQPVPRPKERCVIGFGTSPYRMDLMEQTFLAAKEVFAAFADIRRSGSAALDLCYVAAGRTDGFFEYVLSPWDYAAGSVIIKEVGAKIQAIGNEEWGFDHPIGICAYGQYLGDSLIEIINRYNQREVK